MATTATVNGQRRWWRWRSRWGWCALVLVVGCAPDGGEGTCPPPCLTAELSIEIEIPEVAGYVDDVPILPGAGTYSFEVDVGDGRFTCTHQDGRDHCTGALTRRGSGEGWYHMQLSRGPYSVGFEARYEGTLLVAEAWEPAYEIGGGPLCGQCPEATVSVELPVQAIADAEGYVSEECSGEEYVGTGTGEEFYYDTSFRFVAPHAGTYVFWTECEPDEWGECSDDDATIALVGGATCRVLTEPGTRLEYTAATAEELTVEARTDYGSYTLHVEAV